MPFLLTPAPGTFDRAWKQFSASVINPAASASERKCMRDAFYAGGYAVMSLMMRIGDPDLSESEGAAWVERVTVELRQYGRTGDEF